MEGVKHRRRAAEEWVRLLRADKGEKGSGCHRDTAIVLDFKTEQRGLSRFGIDNAV